MADTRSDTRKRFGLAQWERRVSPFLLVTATSFDKEEEEFLRGCYLFARGVNINEEKISAGASLINQ